MKPARSRRQGISRDFWTERAVCRYWQDDQIGTRLFVQTDSYMKKVLMDRHFSAHQPLLETNCSKKSLDIFTKKVYNVTVWNHLPDCALAQTA